ncbi:beta-lactamase family protein [Sphingobacterium sp. lm-10]|uniref:serine hydrolase domain-containing protein n=1 Tax=Sphingobacterium sp. lm-10 TaxID=2944904 RepID=UPI002021D1B5|nr:serine hydrolase domain-containing protein [Sphingobacterium sp. lm-10]MCL7989218.1 beta-lactamase family protein [Sphingobacterium sp. lm-10]
MYKIYLLLFLGLMIHWQPATAQSADEKINRALYNRIEYLFNSQQADSIYNLASKSFQGQISREQLTTMLQQLYALGNIKNAEQLKFERGVASYRLDFDTERLLFVLGVDSTNHYHTILFQQYKEDPKAAVAKETADADTSAPVEAMDPFDFKIENIAKNYTQKANARSLTIGIIHRGKVQKYFFGETAKGNKTLPTEDNIYEIGSITKTFTATLLADLVERQVISLDDSIIKFLPDSLARNTALHKITFRNLANHTSGLPRLPDNWNSGSGYVAADPYAHYDRKALFAYLRHAKLDHEPETEYAYSNLGYGLLGELIAIISKKPFDACLKETLTQPLHMRATDLKVDPKNTNVLKVYEGGQEVPVWHFQAMAGGGAIKSTIDDLLRYAITQLATPENAIQRAMAATKLFTFYIPENNMDIGLAWHTDLQEDMNLFWHNGGTAGSSSYMAIIPDERSAVIVLSNSNEPLDSTAIAIVREVIKKK